MNTSSDEPIQEYKRQLLEPIKNLRIFFSQRRKILANPDIIILQRESLQLAPLKYFQHGFILVAFVALILSLAFGKVADKLYENTINNLTKLYEQAKSEHSTRNDMDITPTPEKLKEYKERLEYRKQDAGKFISFYSTFRSGSLPITILLSSYMFRMFFKRKSHEHCENRTRAHILHLYVVTTFTFYPVLLMTAGDVLAIYKKAYLDGGAVGVFFLDQSIFVGWIIIAVLFIAGVWGLIAVIRATSVLARQVGSEKPNVFFAVVFINFVTSIIFLAAIDTTYRLWPF